MSYLVLARKYRPRSFDTLVGQDHVVRALTHALSTQRLHHAWLFTGTRGVGKTTLSRILAKSLNCETGVTATPCGQCHACTEIDTGRFVDYVELDAASNRGIDNMTQLLEQAIYAPSVGRFKVYMIDEVHMLTGPAFNAMLKTLEEPPAHVKFVLATTDPQKIPVTVLSRCLQFNLKQMTNAAIVQHLQQVLEAEQIACEEGALRLIAQAAAGSMRDALSLTDQAIAYSADHLTTQAVQDMLGTIDQRHLIDLLSALAKHQAAQLIAVADDLAARGLSYQGALADLAVLLSRVAIAQRLGRVIPNDDPLADAIAALAKQLHPDQTQLFYTIAVHSREELALAPDAYAGFIMVCLRMLALGGGAEPNPDPVAGPDTGGPTAPRTDTATAQAATPAPSVASSSARPVENAPPAWEDAPADTASSTHFQDIPPEAEFSPAHDNFVPDDAVPDASPSADTPPRPSPQHVTRETWPALATTLPVTGVAAELARQSEWVAGEDTWVRLRIAAHTLAQTQGKTRLRTVLSEHFGVAIDLQIELGNTGDDTAHAVAQAAVAARQQQAEQSAQTDPFVQTLVRDFDAQIVPGSIQAISQPSV